MAAPCAKRDAGLQSCIEEETAATAHNIGPREDACPPFARDFGLRTRPLSFRRPPQHAHTGKAQSSLQRRLEGVVPEV